MQFSENWLRTFVNPSLDSDALNHALTMAGLEVEGMGPVDTPVAQDIHQVQGLNDTIFALKLTPNRSDCLSITGIAREVAAITGAVLKLPEIMPVAVKGNKQKAVHVDEVAACPRYCSRLITGVNAQAKTPDWMLRRLEGSGLHGISAIVDITNYVLLETGQPLHAFDAVKLQGDIRVRFANKNEKLVLLNQQTAELQLDMLVIADDTGAVALAGIMGGAATAVSDTTSDIFLESAFFTPTVIAGKGRCLGFSTDSSYRFERGVDYGNTRLALERATALIQEICGGDAGAITEVSGKLPKRQPVRLRLARLLAVLGTSLDEAAVAKLFDQLGFNYKRTAGVFEITPPSYRFDIGCEEDLIEEIARLHGYDNIPATIPNTDLRMLPLPGASLNPAWLRDALTASGYQEVVTYSFVDEAWEHDLLGNAAPIALKNPIASDMSVMRSGLWGGLLDTLVYNLNRKQERVRLFEIGATYFKAGGGYKEVSRISGLAYGDAAPEQWGSAARDVDFFDVKTEVDLLTNGRARFIPTQHPALHPGQSAQVQLDGKAIGWLGKLHPKWQQHYQLPRDTVLFELDTASLLKRGLPQYEEVAKFPPVRRDMAVVVDEKIPVQALIDTMLAEKIPLVSEIALFDVYRGKSVAENKKSLAFLVLMQDTQKTLTDAEADEVMAKLLKSIVRQHDAQLRG